MHKFPNTSGVTIKFWAQEGWYEVNNNISHRTNFVASAAWSPGFVHPCTIAYDKYSCSSSTYSFLGRLYSTYTTALEGEGATSLNVTTNVTVCAVQHNLRGDVYFTPTQYVKKEMLCCNTKDQKVFGEAQLRTKYSRLVYTQLVFSISRRRWEILDYRTSFGTKLIPICK